MQLRLLEEDWPATLLLRPEAAEWRAPDGTLLYRGPRVRVGIHAGSVDVVPGAEGDMVGGPPVYQLARLVAALHGGQVVLSSRAWAAVGELPEGVMHVDLGLHGLVGYQGVDRLHLVVPSALAQRRWDPVRTREHLRTNVPPGGAGFVGRDGDIQALGELLDFGIRVVSVVGPQGVGKSGLLQRFVAVHGHRYARDGDGGAWLCRVEGRGIGAVVGALAATFGLSLRFARTEAEMLRQVGAVLQRRGPFLLAFDGGWTDPAALARAITAWLAAAPEMRVVVAAQRRLGIPGEVAYALQALPEVGPEGARNAPAVRLFFERAAAHSPRIQPQDAQVVAAIANLVGGIPASISLAAGLAANLGLERLVRALEEVEGTPESVVGLVWRSLEATDRLVLSACSVYPAGFDQLGAEAAVDVESTGIDAADALGRLRRAGLVVPVADPRTPGVRRYRVQPLVRRRALRDLDHDTRMAVERRAARRVLSMCEPWSRRAWGPEGIEVLSRLAVEWANLEGTSVRGAVSVAETEDVDLALRALFAMWPLVATQGPAGRFIELANAVLERADVVLDADPVHQARALAARAAARRNVGDLDGALADALRGESVAGRWSDAVGRGFCLLMEGLVRREMGDLDRAAAALEQARDALASAGESGHAAVAQGALGIVLMDQARLDEARASLEAARDALGELGWSRHLGLQYTALGLLHRRAGDLSEARALYARAAQLHREIGDRRALAICLVNKGALELREDRAEEAERTLSDALHAARETGDRRAESRVHGNLALAGLARGDLGAAREHLLAALAIDRGLGDRVAEAVDTAYLGIAAHLGGRLDGARDNYRRALQVLEERAPPHQWAHVLAWSGLAAVEDRDPDAARADFARAREAAARAGAVSVARTVEILASSEALLDGDDGAVREVLARHEARTDVDVRLARARLARLLDEGLSEE